MEFNWQTWFLSAWEDSRRLTNRVARALAGADALDRSMVEGMRPFRAMMLEIYRVEQWCVRGLAHEQWGFPPLPEGLNAGPLEDVFTFGQGIREETRRLWPTIPDEAFTRLRPSPDPYIPEGSAIGRLTYALENEIHHRGQGYVYLRLLGQEPPAFHRRGEEEG